MCDSLMWQAIVDHDATALDRSIAEGANIDARNSAGLTPLMLAAGCGQAAMVRSLLDAGADLFVVGACGGGSALHKACQAGSLEAVQLLIEAGAFINAPAATTGHTPIIEAIWFKWPDVVQYLLDQGAKLSIHTHYGFSLDDHVEYGLHANARGREKLVQCKKQIDARRDSDQERVDHQHLMAAVTDGNLKSVRELLAAGAQVDARYPILGGFNDGQTPLSVACRDGLTEIVVELLNAGADVNAIEPVFLAVPLHKAVYNGHCDITRLLVQQPGIMLNVAGASNGYTPLHDALWHGYDDCAQVLIDGGAELDLRGHDGLTPLDVATEVFGEEHSIVQILRSHLEPVAAACPA